MDLRQEEKLSPSAVDVSKCYIYLPTVCINMRVLLIQTRMYYQLAYMSENILQGEAYCQLKSHVSFKVVV